MWFYLLQQVKKKGADSIINKHGIFDQIFVTWIFGMEFIESHLWILFSKHKINKRKEMMNKFWIQIKNRHFWIDLTLFIESFLQILYL